MAPLRGQLCEDLEKGRALAKWLTGKGTPGSAKTGELAERPACLGQSDGESGGRRGQLAGGGWADRVGPRGLLHGLGLSL